MKRSLNLKQAIKHGMLDEFISQHPHNSVPRDLEERFELVLESMVKGQPTDGETSPIPNPED